MAKNPTAYTDQRNSDPLWGSRCYEVSGADEVTGESRKITVIANGDRSARYAGFSSGMLVSKCLRTDRAAYADASLVYAIERGVIRGLWKFTLSVLVVAIIIALAVGIAIPILTAASNYTSGN